MPPQLYGTLALGALQALGAYTSLNNLNKQPVASYTSDASMKPLLDNQQAYSQRATYGLRPEEQNQYLNQLGSQTAGYYRTATDMAGGNLGSAISRVSALDRVRGLGNLATMNAQARERAMSGVASANSAINRQYNMQTGFEQNYRLQKERALGGALSSGLTNMASGLNFAAMTGNPNSQTLPVVNSALTGAPVSGFDFSRQYIQPDQYGQGVPVQLGRNRNYFPLF